MENLKRHEHIIFGAEHYNPLGVARTLGENGLYSVAIIIRSRRPIFSESRYLKKIYFVDSIDEGYQLLMNVFSNQDNKPFIYTCDDQITSFLDKKYEELVEHFYFFNGGEAGKISYYMDKYNICDLARKHGVPIAKTIAVDKGTIPEGLEYPVITKAIISTIDNWKGDVFICKDENELREAYKSIRSSRVLLQKYIVKKNELCLDGYVSDHGNNTNITIASTYNYVLPDTYSSYMTVKNFEDEDLGNKIKKMFAETGFEGIFSLEFLVGPDDELYFLEINFRNSTWSYASTVAGMPLPIMWAKEMLEKEAKGKVTAFKPFMAINEIDELRCRVKTHQITFFTWLKEIKKSKCKYYFSLRDLKPFLAVFINKFRRIKK